MEIFRLISSGSKSVVVVPSSTLPSRVTAPAANSIDSTSDVLPIPPWPTTPTFLSLAISTVIDGPPRKNDAVGKSYQRERIRTTELAADGAAGRVDYLAGTERTRDATTASTMASVSAGAPPDRSVTAGRAGGSFLMPAPVSTRTTRTSGGSRPASFMM